MVRAFASGAVHCGLILSPIKPMTLQLTFTVSLLNAQHQKDNVEIMPASSLAVALGKALNKIPPF